MKETIRNVPIEDITLDERLQMRTKMDADHVDEIAAWLAEGKEVSRPPVLFHDASGQNWLADGFHTVAGYRKNGAKKAKCLLKGGTYRDALRYALSANATHGLKRSNDDKRRAVETALSDGEWSKLSNGQLAELCGVSDHFVGVVRKELTPIQSESSTVRIGKDGREINTANIGRMQPEPQFEEPEETAEQEPETATAGVYITASDIPTEEPADDQLQADEIADDEETPTPHLPFAPTESQAKILAHRGLEIGTDADGRPLHLARPGEPTDRLGRPLPEHLYETFERGRRWAAINQAIGKFISEVEKDCNDDPIIAKRLNFNRWRGDLKNSIGELGFARPKVVCPNAACNGHEQPKGKPVCPTCKGGLVIVQGDYDSLKQEHRDTAEGYKDGPRVNAAEIAQDAPQRDISAEADQSPSEPPIAPHIDAEEPGTAEEPDAFESFEDGIYRDAGFHADTWDRYETADDNQGPNDTPTDTSDPAEELNDPATNYRKTLDASRM